MKNYNLKEIYPNALGDLTSEDETQVEEISLHKLHAFKGHPFNVLEDADLDQLKQSIEQNGVLTPIIVRLKNGCMDEYEIISGHRRKKACELLEVDTIPCDVRDCTDDEATIIMVDANIQRTTILPSEKAKAYKMKYDAMKHQGSSGGNTAEIIGKSLNESSKTVRRYVKLNELIPELLQLVDEQKLGFHLGVDIADLNKDIQSWIYNILAQKKGEINTNIVKRIKAQNDGSNLTQEVIQAYMTQQPSKDRRFTLSRDKIDCYLPKSMSYRQKCNLIFELLEQWANNQE